MLTTFQYFAPVSWYAAIVQSPSVKVCTQANFIRASTHNRMQLAGANGKHILSVPLQGGRNQRNGLQHIAICYDENWQRNHYRTICSIYRRSPFFEYFEQDFNLFYSKSYDTLWDLNMASYDLVAALTRFKKDLLLEENCTNKLYDFSAQVLKQGYTQVFADKYAFIPDCSIVDSLFCAGPKALENII